MFVGLVAHQTQEGPLDKWFFKYQIEWGFGSYLLKMNEQWVDKYMIFHDGRGLVWLQEFLKFLLKFKCSIPLQHSRVIEF